MTELTDDYIANPVEERVPYMKRAIMMVESMPPADRVRIITKITDIWCDKCGEKKPRCACKKE